VEKCKRREENKGDYRGIKELEEKCTLEELKTFLPFSIYI
jgi:hypothetical protein